MSEHLVIVDEFNLVHRRQHVLLVPKAIFILSNLDRVVKQDLVNRFRRMRHKYSAFEARLLSEVGHGAAVVHVEVRDKQ